MNSTLRDAQALSYRECLLPSTAQNRSVAQVTPAKKITFLKRGDPRFSGVRLAVHQRTFKSFCTLMDELSQRVPLSFGVRSVTTPRGLHGLSALEQLEDGGCYLCSDKKPPKSSPGSGRLRSSFAQHSQDVEGPCEEPGTSSSRRGPQAPRRITLVKNGDPRFQQTVVLSRRNTRSLAAFLSKASDLLLFPVKQVYTTSGEKVDSLKALLCSPALLVCAGHEAFRPLAMEGTRRNGTETLLGQTSSNKNGSWGPKAKQSVIHSRSRAGSRPRRSSLVSETSGVSDPLVSPTRAWMGPPQDTAARPGPLVASDDVEKKVRMNEDGSLSVEMKVRLHLPGNDVLLWSRRIRGTSALAAASEEGPVLGEADAFHRVWEGHLGGSSEPGALEQGPQEAQCKGASERGRWQPGSRYEIWTNPLYTAQGEATASQRRPGPSPRSHSRGPWSPGLGSRERSSKDSASSVSSERPPEDSEPNSSCCSRSREGSVGRCGRHPASRAASQRGAGREAGGAPRADEGPRPEGAGPGSGLKPRTQGVAGALSDATSSAASLEEPIVSSEQHQGHPRKVRAVTSTSKAILRGGTGSPTTCPSSLGNKDLQAEESRQDTGHPQARDGSRTRLPQAAGHFGSGDLARSCSLSSAWASASDGRTQERGANAGPAPSISGLSQGALRGCPRQHHHQRDTHCLLHSSLSQNTPGLPSMPRARPVPPISGSPSSTRNRASRDSGPPSSAPLHSKDIQGLSSVPLTPMSHSECASNFYPPYSPSADTEGDPEFREHSPAPTPPSSLRPQPEDLGKVAGSDVPGPKPKKMSQGQVPGAGEGLGEQEDTGGITPGALPQASPDAVVREWLSNIPEEPVPMQYEMLGDSTDVAGDSQEGPTGDPAEKHSLDGLEERTQARRPSLEGVTSEQAESDAALPVTGDAGPRSGEACPCSAVSEAPEEAGAGKGTAEDSGMGHCVLPRRVSASIQIMKVLMGSRQGQPSSLPEVSSPVGRRLGHSAQDLITCLTKLHFFDENHGSPASKMRFTDSPQYQELLSTFQALWPGCGLRRGELDSELRELAGCQALPGLRPHAVTEDFTLTSSSGVDVGSGSGNSGEGSGPCAVDCTLVPKRLELPLTTPCQQPASRTSANPVDLGNQRPHGAPAASSSQVWACAPGKDGAGGSSGEQMLGSNPDRVVENTMREEGVRLESRNEEKGSTEWRGQGVSGFPAEGRVRGQELPGSCEREGGWEDEREQEGETGRDLATAMLCPLGTRGKWAETLGSLKERDSKAGGGQGGPNAEPSLEKLPAAAETGHEQTQAKGTQGAGEEGTSMALNGSLDPDALWVCKLLRKMEKTFMSHLASAMAELRARWSLQCNDLLDQMVAELQQEVGQRLQDSTETELRKIQSQATGKAVGRPGAACRWDMSLQTEPRRHRLQSLHKLSALSKQTQAQGRPPFSLEDVPGLRGALETWQGGEAKGEEFCPCETCMRKTATPMSPKDTVHVASAPIKEAFDLKQILQKKKGGCANGETAEAAPKKTGMKPLQRNPLGIGTVPGTDRGSDLGLGQGPEAEERDEGESSQTLSRGEDPGRGEKDVATQKRGGNKDPCVDRHLEAVRWEEQGVGDKEEGKEEGSGAQDSVEGEASGAVDESLGRQNDDADITEAQETEGEGQPESGGGYQGETASSQVGSRRGQLGEASGHNYADREGGPTPPSAAGGGAPQLRSGPQTGLSSGSTSSLGNCSQLSQKGSGEEPSHGDTRAIGEEPTGVPGAERKGTGLHPESSTSEQGAPLGSRTPEQGTDKSLTPELGAGQGSDLEAKKVVQSHHGQDRWL